MKVSALGSSVEEVHLSGKIKTSALWISSFHFFNSVILISGPAWVSLIWLRRVFQSCMDSISLGLVFLAEAAWMLRVWSGAFRNKSTTRKGNERVLYRLSRLHEKQQHLNLSIALCLSAGGFLCPLLFLWSILNCYQKLSGYQVTLIPGPSPTVAIVR